MDIINLFFIFIIFISLFILFKKKKLFIDNISYSDHKKIGAENKLPIVIGGPFILIIYLVFHYDHSIIFITSAVSITFLGIMSDKNIISSPSKRLIFQFIIILFLTYFENLQINDLRFDIFNSFLSNEYFNLFFTIFCLAILINGSNFLDGLNGLLTGYYLMILISIVSLLNLYPEINARDFDFLKTIFFGLIIFFIFNIFGLVYLGDSGTYLLSLFVGTYLIKFNYYYDFISPYYIALLLWYPAFENLFSLSRRILKKKKTSSPDNLHLHQLIFIYLQSKKIFSKKILNTSSSIILLLINLPGFIVAYSYIMKSSVLLLIISFNIIIYVFLYYFLSKNLIPKK